MNTDSFGCYSLLQIQVYFRIFVCGNIIIIPLIVVLEYEFWTLNCVIKNTNTNITRRLKKSNLLS